MATVDRRILEGPGKGLAIQKAMGMTQEVQDRLQLEAELGAFRAEANLAIARSKPGYDIRGGHSSIKVERGRIDRYVVLDDTRGLGAAMTIEYGRKAALKLTDDGSVPEEDTSKPGGGMDGLFILRDAMKFGRGSGDRPDIGPEGAEFVD